MSSADITSVPTTAAQFGLSEPEFDLVVGHLGRQPNALEAAMFGALWSEHCGYKNSKPLLARLPTEEQPCCRDPGRTPGSSISATATPSPSRWRATTIRALSNPSQGAATGVGGILRDVFAMGARPFAVLDSLRFGPLESDRSCYLLAGVVEGIAHYGNAIGVPTVGGETHFHDCYRDNPLVNVMALGLMKAKDMKTGTVGAPGNLLIYVGSKTGRDGLGGAVFASADLSDSSDADRPAVQVGDPFMEKLLLEACLEAVREGLVVGIQDMGAAGLTSSVAEMAHRAGRGLNSRVGRVPTREPGMAAAEVMLSESQERMVLVISPERRGELLELLTRWELDAVEVGKVCRSRPLQGVSGRRLAGRRAHRCAQRSANIHPNRNRKDPGPPAA